jgi:hypothetical protein
MPLQIFSNQGNPLENINVTVSNQSQLLNNQNQVINPATLESIQELNSLLSGIKTDIDTKIILSNTNDVKITDSVLPNGASTSVNQMQIYNILNDKLDVNLSTRASESTLSNVNSNIILVKNSVDTANTSIVNAIALKATENTLQSVNLNIATLSSKLDEVKSSIISQLDTQVRGLFDANGNAIDSLFTPIFGFNGILAINVSLDQYLTFNKKIFYYFNVFTLGGNDTKILAIVNPVTNTKTFFVRRIVISRNIDNNNGMFVYIRTNAQGVTGTSVNPTTINSTLGGGTSTATIYTSPNYTSAGNTRFVFGLTTNEGSREVRFDFGFGLNPGENLFLVGNATANGTPCFLTIEWAEV